MTRPVGRGLYGDPEGARGVLEALGGEIPQRREPAPPMAREPQRAYRGRCGNGQHEAQKTRIAGKVIELQAASSGCDNEAAPDPNPLKLCEKCLAKYRGAMPVPREHEAALDRVESMPGLCSHGQRAWQCEGICFRSPDPAVE